jgi:bacillolysin/neutral peptidase B
MKDFVHTTADEGGVHANSSIHSKAAYNVLTARRGGQYLFRPADVAVLYYLALQRLGRLATFAKARQALLDAARTFYAGDAGRKAKIAGIEQAYAQVGIA